jgi:hypothetical protein
VLTPLSRPVLNRVNTTFRVSNTVPYSGFTVSTLKPAPCLRQKEGVTEGLLCTTDALQRQIGKKAKETFTTVTYHNPSISGLPHDRPSSVARQQRKKPDPRPPQAAGALKIALLGAHALHVPRGALEELDHSTLLLRPLSGLCRSHLQAIPRLCGGIEQHLCSPKHHRNIGPQIPFCSTRSTRAERSVST